MTLVVAAIVAGVLLVCGEAGMPRHPAPIETVPPPLPEPSPDFHSQSRRTLAPLPSPAEPETVENDAPRTSRAIDRSQLDDLRLVAQVTRLYDGRPTDLAWAQPGDMATLRELVDLWKHKVLAARRAVLDAASPLHLKRYDAGLCQEYPADKHSVGELQKPEHDGQVVLVGSFRYPNGVNVHRVSRFAPGDDPKIDAAQLALATTRATLRAELERIRAGR